MNNHFISQTTNQPTASPVTPFWNKSPTLLGSLGIALIGGLFGAILLNLFN